MADAVAEAPVEIRLLNGAKILGQLWRAGGRCEEGWACGCVRKTSKLCLAKGQWFALAVVAGRTAPEQDGPYGLIEMMTVSEFDATGLTIAAELAGIGTYKIGPRGVVRMTDILELVKDPAGIASVFRVIDKFPGSRVVKIEEPKKEGA